jgi:hypothetical protein
MNVLTVEFKERLRRERLNECRELNLTAENAEIAEERVYFVRVQRDFIQRRACEVIILLASQATRQTLGSQRTLRTLR